MLEVFVSEKPGHHEAKQEEREKNEEGWGSGRAARREMRGSVRKTNGEFRDERDQRKATALRDATDRNQGTEPHDTRRGTV